MSRRLAWLLCAALAMAMGCSSAPEHEGDGAPEDEVWLTPDQMSSSNVRTAKAQEEDLPQFLTVGGRVAFDDLRVAHVLSPVTGRITRVIAQPGDKVKKGSPLLAIASPDVGSAVSDVVKAQADLNAALHDYRRQQELVAANAGPKRDLDAAEDNYRKAQAEMERARKKAELLKSGNIDRVTQEYTLLSPIDGEVIARLANPGVEVQGQYSGGAPVELFTVGDIDSVWLYGDIAQADLPKVKLGARMTLKVLAYPDRSFEGQITWMADTLDPATRTLRIRCDLPNPDHLLKPEMFGEVSIATSPVRALALPKDAIIQVNEHQYVFVQTGRRKDGRMVFKRRLIRTGVESPDGRIAVLEGLSPGEQVVIEGSVTREQPNDQAWLTEEQFRSAGIKVAVITDQDFVNPISIGGRVTFDDQHVSHVFSPVSGRVTHVLAEPGQKVARGTPLLKLVSPDVGSALSDLVKAQADLAAAQHEYERQKELFAAHAGAQRDLETADDAYLKAKAELDRAQQKTKLLRSGDIDKVTQEYTLKSPIDGDVVARNVTPGLEIQGQYSAGGAAVELFTIGDLSHLWFLGDVYETDLPDIHKGAAVAVKLEAYPDKVFHGVVDWVSDVLDPATRTAKVRCILENTERLLKPEMYEIATVAAARSRALAVPREAVLRIGNETYVFVASGNTANGELIFRRRKVVVGGQGAGALVPVLEGLSPGETVAVDNPIFLLGLL